jgi:superfamily II DNA or RNA helicase
MIKTFNILKENPDITFTELKQRKNNKKQQQTKNSSEQIGRQQVQFGDGFTVDNDDDNENDNDDDSDETSSRCLLDSDDEEENLSDTEEVNKMKNIAVHLYRANADDKLLVYCKNKNNAELITKIIDHSKITDSIQKEKKQQEEELKKKQNGKPESVLNLEHHTKTDNELYKIIKETTDIIDIDLQNIEKIMCNQK